MEDKKQPIIVKRIKKGGHSHHGGAWKVAFADFVTAMMAFFMLMWLLGSVPQETLAGISDYFESVSLTEGKAPVPSEGMNGPGGASTSMIKLGGSMNINKGEGDKVNQANKSDSIPEDAVEAAAKAAEKAEKERLEELMKDMVEAIGKNKALSPYKDQLVLEVTAEGLQIQIVDKEGRAMFDSGGAQIKNHMREILHEIAGFLNTVPNKVSISGHTDATPFSGREDYSNWELSADRANAARRTLGDGGLEMEKIGRVEGLASSRLFDHGDPYNKSNRRISILVMNKKTELAVTGGAPVSMLETDPGAPVNTAPPEPKPVEMLQPVKDPINPVPAAPLPPTVTEQDTNLKDISALNKPAEQPGEPAEPPPPAGKINLPPIIDPVLLPGQ